jgi:hypothetical protein
MEDDVLTVMFVRQSGKIRTIKIEVKKLFILAIGIISIILALGGLIYGYFSIYKENNDLLAMVGRIEQNVESLSKVKGFEDKTLKETNKSVIVEVPATQKETTEIYDEKSQKKIVENLEGKLDEIFITDSDSYKVALKDFQVAPNDKQPGIKVIFSITNSKKINKITGYWIIVGENKRKNAIAYRSFPNFSLDKNGEIINYKDPNLIPVTWFSIERLKPVKGELKFDDEFNDYDTIYIYIYSINGELLLKSKFNRWLTTA